MEKTSKSKINRYKNPKKQISYIDKWAKENYKLYGFRLHKIEDKEIIKAIENRKVSMRELIKSWYFNKK